MAKPAFLHFQDEQLLDACRTRDQITGAGAVHALEERLKSHYGKRYCLSTCNATTALLATAMATGLRDKEVLASPLNWGGSIGPFALMGNVIALGVLRHDDLNLAPEFFNLCISERTAAVLVNDQGGTVAEGQRIREFCDAHGLLYISDSACSLGAFDHMGKAAGHHAHVTITSFVADKGVSAGEGGAVLTDDAGIYERLLLTAAHPERQRKELGYHNPCSPLNSRIHPLAAQVLVSTWEAQMHRLRDKQQRIARMLRGIRGQYQVGCYMPDRASTFQSAMLCAMPGIELTFAPIRPIMLHEQEQYGVDPVQFRMPSITRTWSEVLRENRYLPLTKVIEGQWHLW